MLYLMDADQVRDEIVTALAGYDEDFDIARIADKCYHWVPNRGFVCNVDPDEFWSVVWESML